MQGKLFQRCTHILYYSALSLGGNVNTRRMSKPDMGSIFHISNQWNFLVIGNYYVNYQNYQNSMLLTSSDSKRTLRHLFLFTNSAQCFNMYAEYTQLQITFLHYILDISINKNFFFLDFFYKHQLSYIYRDCSEMKSFELDTLNTDRLIWTYIVDTFDFCLIRSFPSF